jgi:hypothetical protein
MAGKATADEGKTPLARKRSRARTTRSSRKKHEVTLGRIAENGIAGSLLGLIERGATKRPTLARELRGSVEIRFKEDFAPVRAIFGSEGILVEDGIEESEDAEPFKPDLVISGSLPQIVQLTSAPLFGGLPKPTDSRGRAALAKVAGRKVKIEGNPLLARRVLKLLEI